MIPSGMPPASMRIAIPIKNKETLNNFFLLILYSRKTVESIAPHARPSKEFHV